MQKQCTKCNTDNENSFAMELLKGYSAQAKRWFAISLVILTMWLTTIGAFVWYLNQYDFEGVEMQIEQDATDGGNANYIGNDGEIANGLSENNH